MNKRSRITTPTVVDIVFGMHALCIVPILLVFTCLAVRAQTSILKPVVGATGSKNKSLLSPGALPAEARVFLRQMGKRLTSPGEERITLIGTYTDKSGSSPFRLIRQNPDKVQFVLEGAAAKTLTFDGAATGTTGSGGLALGDRNLLAALADDFPDAVFLTIAEKSSIRLLGSRFRTDDGKNPAYAGPWFTIYEATVPSAATKSTARKLFIFDTKTGLLNRVTYLGDKSVGATPFEIQYSDWQTVNGEQYPGKVIRKSVQGVDFTLTLGTPRASAAAADQIFTAAK